MTTAKVETLIDLLNAKGGTAYFGEPVSILEHSLQAAHAAELAAAGPAAISAALLHDIGHMLHGLDEEIAQRGQDGMHEEVAAKYHGCPVGLETRLRFRSFCMSPPSDSSVGKITHTWSSCRPHRFKVWLCRVDR